jgi:hypothetical protein
MAPSADSTLAAVCSVAPLPLPSLPGRIPSAPAADPSPTKLELAGVVLDESRVLRSRTLPYVRMLVSLIERIEVSHVQLVALLRSALRQQRIANRRRCDYVVDYLQRHPP